MVLDPATLILGIMSGALTGLILGVVGGGGSILAVPLLVYVVGVSSPHIAIGTSALAVAVSALTNLASKAKSGLVKWRCGAVFALSGMIGAFGGANLAKLVDGQKLLGLFGILMIIIGIAMFHRPETEGVPDVKLTRASARRLVPLLVGIGFTVGILSGFFGIGGGFLIVPGLMLATGMPITFAIGTSLVAVSAFGATTSITYALSGLIDWPLTLIFIVSAVIGGLLGTRLGTILAARKALLGRVFAGIVIVVGVFVTTKAALIFLA